jgi:hypothetical protein
VIQEVSPDPIPTFALHSAALGQNAHRRALFQVLHGVLVCCEMQRITVSRRGLLCSLQYVSGKSFEQDNGKDDDDLNARNWLVLVLRHDCRNCNGGFKERQQDALLQCSPQLRSAMSEVAACPSRRPQGRRFSVFLYVRSTIVAHRVVLARMASTKSLSCAIVVRNPPRA